MQSFRQIHLFTPNFLSPIWFKPSFQRRYVNDIFVSFESAESAYSFYEYMSSKHQDIRTSPLTGKHWLIFVLRSQIFGKNGTFVTSVYRKPTFGGISKVSFQRTKRGEFCIHNLIGVLAYVVTSRHFILKLIMWRLSS